MLQGASCFFSRTFLLVLVAYHHLVPYLNLQQQDQRYAGYQNQGVDHAGLIHSGAYDHDKKSSSLPVVHKSISDAGMRHSNSYTPPPGAGPKGSKVSVWSWGMHSILFTVWILYVSVQSSVDRGGQIVYMRVYVYPR